MITIEDSFSRWWRLHFFSVPDRSNQPAELLPFYIYNNKQRARRKRPILISVVIHSCCFKIQKPSISLIVLISEKTVLKLCDLNKDIGTAQ